MVTDGRLTRRQRRRMHRAVKEAESTTGLQFSVYLGGVHESDPRASAEELFATTSKHTAPAVLVVVAPAQRRVEIVTGPTARLRINDVACQGAVTRMTESFARGYLAGGILTGLADLAAAAGPGRAAVGDEDLPDVIDSVAEPSSG